MTDHQRGAYTPPTQDAPLSFDPRQPVRGARPIPFTLILAVLVLAALVAAIFYFYQSGVREAGQAPQVVGAPAGEIKSAPSADAQPQEPAAGLQVYKEEQGAPLNAIPAAPSFTQGPEAPQARPTPPVTVTQAPPAQPAPVQSAPAAAIKPAIPAQQPPAAGPVAPPKVAAELAPKIAAPPPAAKTPAPAPEKAAPAKVVAAPPPKPAPAKAEPAKVKPKAAAAAGGAVVQIGAVSSTELAEKAWRDAVAVAPGLAAGKGKGVEKIDKNGATLYRTAVTGFASKADAQAFCAKLQAAGKSCFVR